VAYSNSSYISKVKDLVCCMLYTLKTQVYAMQHGHLIGEYKNLTLHSCGEQLQSQSSCCGD
jgi:hypothetical protein